VLFSRARGRVSVSHVSHPFHRCRSSSSNNSKLFLPQDIMDPAGKEISMDAAIKMMNDQAHYEVKRNVCLAVLLYFGTLSPSNS
jgi:hypothetical protein